MHCEKILERDSVSWHKNPWCTLQSITFIAGKRFILVHCADKRLKMRCFGASLKLRLWVADKPIVGIKRIYIFIFLATVVGLPFNNCAERGFEVGHFEDTSQSPSIDVIPNTVFDIYVGQTANFPGYRSGDISFKVELVSADPSVRITVYQPSNNNYESTKTIQQGQASTDLNVHLRFTPVVINPNVVKFAVDIF